MHIEKRLSNWKNAKNQIMLEGMSLAILCDLCNQCPCAWPANLQEIAAMIAKTRTCSPLGIDAHSRYGTCGRHP
jgi:hypothetical protein